MGKEIVSWQEALKAQAEKAKTQVSKLTQSTATILSFKHGKLRVGSEDMDNPLEVVILSLRGERAWYEDDYDPDNPTPPSCYSFDGVTPHPEAADPQADACPGCPWNEFGTKGKGKACKEGGRLALAVVTEDGGLEDETLQAKTSVSNTKTLRSYIERLSGPAFMYSTFIENRPDPKTQYRLAFRAGKKLQLTETRGPILAERVEEAERLLAQPYPKPDDKPAKSAKPTRGGVKRSKF